MLRPYQNYHREFQKPDDKKKRHAYWLLAFGILQTAIESQLFGYTTGLVNGSLTPNQWGASVMSTLNYAHPVAYAQGAQSMGGDVTPAEAQILLSQTMMEQAEFLAGFVDDLENGDTRYRKTLTELYPDMGTEAEILERVRKGELAEPFRIEDDFADYWDERNINLRLRLYAERLRGTANWGAIDMLSPTDEIYWRDRKDESECADCPEFAKNVYVKGTLPAVPGDGHTECGVNCRCHLETADGSVIMF